MKVTLLGVGLMGLPMAKNLIAAGVDLTLWNRTKAKCELFVDQAAIADSPEEAVAEAEFVITMLENGPVVDEVMLGKGAAQAMPEGATWVDMSSVPPELARRHAAVLSEMKKYYLDAPVSGGTVGAESRTLSIMAGGDHEQFKRAKPLFDALGTATYIGPAGAGQLAKLANQAIVGITIGAVSEALMLAAQGGADPAAVKQALSGGFAASRILELHGQRMLDRDFEPGARARVQLKDMRTILDEARAQDLTLPLSQLTHDAYLSLVADGQEGVDHSGLLLGLEKLNGKRLDGEKIEPVKRNFNA